MSVSRKWKKFRERIIDSNREKCVRERLIEANNMFRMVLANRFLTTQNLYNNKNLNHNNISVHKIRRMLNDEQYQKYK
jgi:hypothetical protein